MDFCGYHVFHAGGPYSAGSVQILALYVPGYVPEHVHEAQPVLQDTDPVSFFYQQSEAGGAAEPCVSGYQSDTQVYGRGIRRDVFHSADHDSVFDCDVYDQLENDPAFTRVRGNCFYSHQGFLAPYPQYLSQAVAESG